MTSTVRDRAPWRRLLLGMIAFVLLVTVVAAIGSLGTISGSEQYLALRQPAWAPPSWLFGPVWTVLYVLIALAGWKLWWSAGSFRAVRNEMLIYGAGLVLNAVWPLLFFSADLRLGALIEIVVLDVVTAVTILAFARRDRVASSLLVPYQVWILFATALNAAIVVMN